MKINELTKFAITLFLLPVIPAFVLYKHGLYKAAIMVIAVLWLTSFICFISKKFAQALKSSIEACASFAGKYIAIVVLFVVYILTVIPTGMLMKLVKRDRLRLKRMNVNSYWVDNNNKTTDYEYQF